MLSPLRRLCYLCRHALYTPPGSDTTFAAASFEAFVFCRMYRTRVREAVPRQVSDALTARYLRLTLGVYTARLCGKRPV